jgi:hypothetical protein
MDYIIWLIDVEPAVSNFKKYQQQLIDLFNENKRSKYIREKIYELANNLFVKNIEVDDFRKRVDKIYIDADILYKSK